MSYTPGPWKAQSFAGEWLVWGNAKGRAVAYQVEEKNARLIAAAPELVEALEAVCARLELEYTDGPCVDQTVGAALPSEIYAARALLARIKGES